MRFRDSSALRSASPALAARDSAKRATENVAPQLLREQTKAASKRWGRYSKGAEQSGHAWPAERQPNSKRHDVHDTWRAPRMNSV